MPSTSKSLIAILPALALFLLGGAFAPVASAQEGVRFEGRGMIHGQIDEGRRQTLSGNTRSELSTGADIGRVADETTMEHMVLQLSRSPQQEQAARAYIDSLHDPASPNFHHWMTAAQFGQAFGASAADIQILTTWLSLHGFTVNAVMPGGMAIDFSGTAGAVREAFRTEIHALDVNGRRHIANASDPSIPEALAPAVAGIASLHDFSPKPKRRFNPQYSFNEFGQSVQAVTPGDLAVIYDLNPLFSAGIAGQNQTIAVIEDTDLYSTADWTSFRNAFGLNAYGGTLKTVHPAPANGGAACGDPGVVAGDAQEAALDAEWAGAAAPGATIELVSCASTKATFGGLIALQNLVNSASPPSVISMSYGECEAENGASANAAYYAIFQQAAAEGISVFVSAGDENAASCDAGAQTATHGIGVSAFASTPYNVAVGGTDFGDSAAGTNSRYWSGGNSATYVSALSYIPEIPWNDSCASQLLAQYFGYATTYGSTGFCASSLATAYGLKVVAGGSGGPSGCAYGQPSSYGVVGGSCAGYAKPTWQTGTGVPGDGVRDIPDVSLFAADGIWGHFYIFCYSNRADGGTSCTGAPKSWIAAGGTSFAAPIMAAIQALVNQKAGGPQGNPNPVYYKLASQSGKVCQSNGTIGTGCVFHNVTTGDIDVDCSGSIDCYGSVIPSTGSGRTNRSFFGDAFPLFGGIAQSQGIGGVLSTSSSSFNSAYAASPGWNFATGLGSVDAYNLVMNWSSGR